MKLEELNELYKTKEYPHYMIMYGEEQRIIDEYIKVFENVVYYDTITEAYNNSRIKKIESKVYVVIDDKEYTMNENAQKSILSHFKHSKDILILRYNKVDKKTKFFIHNKNYMIEFNKLSDETLDYYIKQHLHDFNTSKELIKLCNNDYGKILLEIDKIKRIVDIYNCDSNKAYTLIKDQIVENKGDIIFELTNSILYGDVNKSLSLLEYSDDLSPIAVSTILYNGFRNLLLYQGLGKDKRNAKERTGLSGWQIKQCIDLVGGYNIKEIQRNMKVCQEVESGIKMGTLDTNLALDYLVINILK